MRTKCMQTFRFLKNGRKWVGRCDLQQNEMLDAEVGDERGGGSAAHHGIGIAPGPAIVAADPSNPPIADDFAHDLSMTGKLLVALIVLCLGGGFWIAKAQAAEHLEGGIVRARVRVSAGLHERPDFAGRMSLDAQRLIEALPSKALPVPLTVEALDLERKVRVPCRVAVVKAADKPDTPVSVDVFFLVAGPLPVMASREFEIALGKDLPQAGELKAPPPFLSVVPVETVLLSLDMTGPGNVYRLDEKFVAGKTIVNGGFECDTWLSGSVGPGWTHRPFFYAAPPKTVRADAVAGDPKSGKAVHLLGSGLVSAPFEVTPGARYLVRFRARAGEKTVPQGALVAFKLVGPKGADDHAALGHVNWPDIFLTPEWRSYEKILPVPYGPKWGHLIIKTRTDYDFWVDDVQVEKLDHLAPVARFDSAAVILPKRSDPEEASHEAVAWNQAEKALTLMPCENLITNGSFEQDGGWTLTQTNPPLLERSKAMKRTGEYALCFKPPAGAAKPVLQSSVSQKFTIDPEQPYALSLNYRLNISSSLIRIRVETDDRAILLDDVLVGWAQFPAERGDGWMRRTVVIPSGLFPPKSEKCEATLSLFCLPKQNGPGYVDSVCLVQGSKPACFGEKKTYPEEGTVVSEITDLGLGSARIAWEADAPEGTSLILFARTGASPWHVENAWNPWRPVENNGEVQSLGKGMDQFVQWKAVLRTTRGDATPKLRWVEIRRDPASGALVNPKIRITALKNGEITRPALDWLKTLQKEEPLDEWLKNPDYLEMVKTAGRQVAPFHDDFDQQDALFTYFKNLVAVNYGSSPDSRRPPLKKDSRLSILTLCPSQYFRWFESGTRGDETLYCGHYGIIYCTFCRAAGIPARGMGLGALAGGGHDMCEVWSDQFQNWYFTDAQYGGIITLDGIPQSLLEIQELYYRDQYHRLRVHVGGERRDPQMYFENAWGTLSDSHRVGRLNISPYSDWLSTHFPGWNEERMDLCRWYIPPECLFMNVPYYLERNEKSYTIGALKGREELDFKLNQVEMAFDVTGPDSVKLRLRHSGMDFDHYEMAIDGKEFDLREDAYAWRLNPGANHISARTVNRQGHKGKEFTADLWREPAD
ncbi:MAG: transglutaminase domain-containing protein [Verrucomicrobia bacterium]|nr:transglutaminase domain-containing protein [Verrucomicrobiota bacterium]